MAGSRDLETKKDQGGFERRCLLCLGRRMLSIYY
jgi:hypothetical protein